MQQIGTVSIDGTECELEQNTFGTLSVTFNNTSYSGEDINSLVRKIKQETESEVSYEFGMYKEITNKFGYPQYVQCDDGDEIPVCPSCKACVMPNRGQGTQCDKCNYEDDMHFEHDLF